MEALEIKEFSEKFHPLLCGMYPLSITKQGIHFYVYDRWRKKNVVLTPEEWVRQHFLHFLMDSKGYPFSRISVESSIDVFGKRKRADAIVYDNNLHPILIIECKAPTISIQQKTINQIGTYNIPMDVKNLIITNGNNFLYYQINEQKEITILDNIPDYTSLP